ncbi:replication-relaxation family protein [Photobacterium leiognathi]|uniref:replication-relaxation family protein n=1 Tax=Photobacterium leiognathi TaxID=553611 RepID=UPI0027392711|nr:mobilization protein [Photobacterium leiognathi]
MLISDSKKRLQINSDKRKKILMFLLENRYSNLDNISVAINQKSNAGASRVLQKLIAEKLVKKVVINKNFVRVTLFGITQKGIDELNFFVDDYSPFYPSRVSTANLKHTLINQRILTVLKKRTKKNYTDIKTINAEFGNLKQYEHIYKFKHRPDGLFVAKEKENGEIVVFIIETELSLKNTKRYKEIFREYIQHCRATKIRQVLYFVRDDSAKKRLRKIIDTIAADLSKDRAELDLIQTMFHIYLVDKFQN